MLISPAGSLAQPEKSVRRMGQAHVGVNVGIIETHKERAKAAEGT